MKVEVAGLGSSSSSSSLISNSPHGLCGRKATLTKTRFNWTTAMLFDFCTCTLTNSPASDHALCKALRAF